MDGIDDEYNWAFLVSVALDQEATARFLAGRFPDKKSFAFAPLTNDDLQKSLLQVTTHFLISKDQVKVCVMPAMVKAKRGWIGSLVEYAPTMAQLLDSDG